MLPDPDRRHWPRITIRHLVILVAFAAVALAVLMPQVRHSDGPWSVAFLACVELPYALLIPAVILVRHGPAKTWLLAFLCSVPMVAVLALCAKLYLTYFLDDPGFTAFSLFWLAFLLLFVSPVAGCLAVLMRWVVPRSCPTCRRPALLRDPSVPLGRGFAGPTEPRTCQACGSRFRRERRGPWVDVASLLPRPAFAGRPSPIPSTSTTEHDPR